MERITLCILFKFEEKKINWFSTYTPISIYICLYPFIIKNKEKKRAWQIHTYIFISIATYLCVFTTVSSQPFIQFQTKPHRSFQFSLSILITFLWQWEIWTPFMFILFTHLITPSPSSHPTVCNHLHLHSPTWALSSPVWNDSPSWVALTHPHDPFLTLEGLWLQPQTDFTSDVPWLSTPATCTPCSASYTEGAAHRWPRVDVLLTLLWTWHPSLGPMALPHHRGTHLLSSPHW